jgi:hypothetical protein
LGLLCTAACGEPPVARGTSEPRRNRTAQPSGTAAGARAAASARVDAEREQTDVGHEQADAGQEHAAPSGSKPDPAKAPLAPTPNRPGGTARPAADSGAANAPADAGTGARDAASPNEPPQAGSGATVSAGLTHQYTEHLGQLTGEAPNTLRPLGMTGTDLGVSFERGDRLYFLFGDSWTVDPRDSNHDSLAWVDAAAWSGKVPQLTWLTQADGKFLPLRLDGVDLGAMNVPLEAVSVAERTYLFFNTGWNAGTQLHGTSVLAHADGDDFSTLQQDHAAASDKFLNISAVRDGDTLWIFGSGHYRHSPVYLARANVDSLTDRASWTYFRGGDALGPDESSAQPLVDDDCVGELSVRKHAALGYLMAYNCGSEPRGIWLRVAQQPLGPWSEPVLIYEPSLGYEHFIHAQQSTVGYDDGLSERGREQEWGGEYGPYLIPSWSAEPAPGVHAIVFTLSSWNPYQVHLLRAVLTQPGATTERPAPGVGLPRAALQNPGFADGSLAGWQADGDAFRTFRDDANGGVWTVTTFAEAQDSTRGRLWQDFTIDAQTSSLHFDLHGGHASVALYEGDVALRRSRGRDDNNTRSPVAWNLTSLRGKTVRLLIEDDLNESWGFVSVSGFALR